MSYSAAGGDQYHAANFGRFISRQPDRKRADVPTRHKVCPRACQGMMEEQKECLGFEPGTFVALVDKVVIQHDGYMEFRFRNGMKCEYSQQTPIKT